MKRHLTQQEIDLVLKMMEDEIPKKRVIKLLKTESRTFKRMTEEVGIEYPLFKKRIINRNPFEDLEDDRVQYWLGWLGTDGYVEFKEGRISLTVGIKDIDIVEKFRDFLSPKLKLVHSIHHGKFEQIGVGFKNKDVANFLQKKVGFCENKTFNYYPKIKITKHYIRGAFEGDGYLRWGDSKELSIMGANKTHMEIIFNWLSEQGFHPKFHERTPKKNQKYYTVHLYRRDEIQDLLDLIYEDADTYLERKYQLARLVRNDERKGPKFGETASATPSQASTEYVDEGVTTLRGPLSM